MSDRFLGNMAGHYLHRQFRVFRLWRGERPPEGWQGAPPDLYAEKGGVRVAFIVESPRGFRRDRAFARARDTLRNPGVKVYLFPQTRRSYRMATAFRRGLPPGEAERVRVFSQDFQKGRSALVALRYSLETMNFKQMLSLLALLVIMAVAWLQMTVVLPGWADYLGSVFAGLAGL